VKKKVPSFYSRERDVYLFPLPGKKRRKQASSTWEDQKEEGKNYSTSGFGKKKESSHTTSEEGSLPILVFSGSLRGSPLGYILLLSSLRGERKKRIPSPDRGRRALLYFLGGKLRH